MRLSISSPDGLGDFILRLPLIEAWRGAGHELQLLMRRPAADLAAYVFPEVEIVLIARDPYHPATRQRTNPFPAEHRAIRRFRPDLYVAPLFNLSFFDQVWLEQNRGRAAGFESAEKFWASGATCDPHELARRFAPKVRVEAGRPEIEKNQRLAEALLGREVSPFTPRLAANEPVLAAARALLARAGLAEGRYWITCVGNRPGVDAKDWGEGNWKEFFSSVPGEPLVFLGNPKESASIDRIRETLPVPSVNFAAEPPEIPVSLGLVALSAGYLGRDSGVMHLAAALDKPLLAVFGAGHGRRFLPMAKSGVVVTPDCPCRGGDFFCAHGGVPCIREIPQTLMREAWEVLRSGPDGLKVLEARLPADGLENLAREASLKYSQAVQEWQRWKDHEARPTGWLDTLGRRLRRLAGYRNL